MKDFVSFLAPFGELFGEQKSITYFFVRSGGAWGSTWGRLGVILEEFGVLGVFVEALLGVLGLSWGALGVLWGTLGVLLGALGVFLGTLGVGLGCSGAAFWFALGLLWFLLLAFLCHCLLLLTFL